MVITNFDFTITKVKLEHFLYQEKREQEISYRLENEKGKEINYRDILWRPFEEDEILAGYWVYQGMLSGYDILNYTSVNSPDAIKKYCSIVEYEIVEINKIDENWYYVSFE